jgi:GTP-binding protein
MFYDQAKISVTAGRGGDGMMSFRREALVPKGGPNGGNGGRGGDVILVVNPHLNSLLNFQYLREFEADDGKRGGVKDMTGRSGKPKYVEVPPGTLIRDGDTNVLIGDLTRPGQQLVVAKGGRGGRGNAMFVSATNQAPQIAENGAPGETRSLALELKLIADIGIVGKPNAGKSTLLSVVTAAKPKIANYPFTTLSPNLGVAKVAYDRTVVVADIPGLIEGASQGIGLGHEFLRHIERTRVLIHLIDGMAEDPLADFNTINAELAAFGHGLDQKPQVVALTKMDLPDARAAFDLYGPQLTAAIQARGIESHLFQISSAANEQVRELLARAVVVLDELPPLEETVIEEPLVDVVGDDGVQFDIERVGGGFRVHSARLDRRVQMTRWDLEDSVLAFQRYLTKTGIGPALIERGVKPGDMVYIGDYEMEWSV